MPGTTKATHVTHLPPPQGGKLTHFSIELVFDDALHEVRSKLTNPKSAIKVQLECKTETADWEKIYTGLSKSYIHTGLLPSKQYSYRVKVDSPSIKSDWSAIATIKTVAAPYTGDDLHQAIRRGNLEKVKEILQSGDVHPDAQDEKDFSALVVAGLQEKFEIMETLLEHGADVNRKDASGKTPLIHAASRDLLQTIKWLCEHGADAKMLDKSGMAAIHHAVDGGFVKVVEWMLDNSEKYGFDIEQIETTGGMTPLNRCANMTPDAKAYELAASLQLRGANMSSKAYNNFTPLLNAIIRRKPKLVEFFLARGADIYEKNENGQTPYEIAQSVGNTQILRAFEEKIQQMNLLPKSKRKVTPNQEVEVS
ncbi:fibronectin type 3 and ankyrin repeat domains 1 protein-like isoform X2 [Physella acuta]|uniref:fibronectin type 3 and ankyrin repeat domains 1 protein-like isoform X2 n=1 Tax=Physella acuta TaxID=109671 RepID=UPI0027DC139A|nr:fibronectin type 3 and ankyrin repeat domains 1 protein-like isoform X2 [Physella acuta]